MNINSIFEKLEFDKILFSISQYALCETTTDQIKILTPQIDIDKIKYRHNLVSELRLFFENKGKLSFNKLYDFKEQLDYIEKKQFLDGIYLYKIAFSMTVFSSLKQAFAKDIYSNLDSIFNNINVENIDFGVYKKILSNINEDGTINDTASKELSQIRKSIFSMDGRINNEIKTFYKAMEKNNYTTDTIITLRNGFPCILINPSFKRKVDGVVIDSSASGQTVFVTSNRVIALHNELISLRDDEQKEIMRILTNYTDSIKLVVDVIFQINRALLFFDEIYAKTIYAIKNGLNSPEIVSNQIIDLIDAKHPLIQDAIPLTVSLGADYNILIITGPNTGGKTVALKTIGLLSLMVQTGIPIPASSSSRFGVFKNVFVSMGDDQSIEDSLSTFSAQILDLIEITRNANEYSLVLLDELGSGTDPIEGSSLAISIALFLREKNILSIITTHFEELKYLASNENGLQNASMKFDLKAISPLYKLETGIPGKSFAFEIAEQLGLSGAIIHTAKKYVNNDYLKISTMLNSLHTEKQKLEEKEIKLNKLQFDLDEMQKRYMIREEEFKNKEKELNRIIKSKENEFLSQARKDFENIVKKIKEDSASKKSIKEGKTFLEIINKKIISSDEDSFTKQVNKEFIVGEKVLIKSQDHKGIIVALANSKNEFLIQVGSMTMYIDASDLEKVKQNNNNKKNINKTTKITIEKSTSKNSLDLRGTRYEEAIFQIEKFIDEALSNNRGEIKIIHGIGTGAIRQCVQETLRKSPFVTSFDFEKNDNQGTNFGVTVAHLK